MRVSAPTQKGSLGAFPSLQHNASPWYFHIFPYNFFFSFRAVLLLWSHSARGGRYRRQRSATCFTPCLCFKWREYLSLFFLSLRPGRNKRRRKKNANKRRLLLILSWSHVSTLLCGMHTCTHYLSNVACIISGRRVIRRRADLAFPRGILLVILLVPWKAPFDLYYKYCLSVHYPDSFTGAWYAVETHQLASIFW